MYVCVCVCLCVYVCVCVCVCRAGFPTTLEQDTSELQRVLTSAANTDINNTNGSTDSSGASASKAVDVAVLRYRIERKELLTTLALVLDIYARR